MLPIHLLLIAFVLFGDTAVWIAVRNRAHALPLLHGWKKLVDFPQVIGTVALPIWLGWRYTTDPNGFVDPRQFWTAPVIAYAAVCGFYGIWVTLQWMRRTHLFQPVVQLVENHTQKLDIAADLGSSPALNLSTRIFAAIPFNRPFTLSIHEKTLELPRLPSSLAGLSIAHLSDLHFCGNVALPFFESVVEEANDLNADLVAITGDIVEKVSCFPWLPVTLGRLRARHGVYFVLGNHDKVLPDVHSLRRQLVDMGLIDLGRESKAISIRGQKVLLAGNELPWFGPPPSFLAANETQFGLRLLLSHSPDQLPWARARDFDLMLCGHTHGGQIRLPVIGPIVCPSRYGVRYASGVFYEAPTLMHVSRGISGEDALRINCPPELTKLVLKPEAN
jgi:predicted MPP superfamily phosphohydrolase